MTRLRRPLHAHSTKRAIAYHPCRAPRSFYPTLNEIVASTCFSLFPVRQQLPQLSRVCTGCFLLTSISHTRLKIFTFCAIALLTFFFFALVQVRDHTALFQAFRSAGEVPILAFSSKLSPVVFLPLLYAVVTMGDSLPCKHLKL